MQPQDKYKIKTFSHNENCHCCNRDYLTLQESVFIFTPTGMLINANCVDDMHKQNDSKESDTICICCETKSKSNFITSKAGHLLNTNCISEMASLLV